MRRLLLCGLAVVALSGCQAFKEGQQRAVNEQRARDDAFAILVQKVNALPESDRLECVLEGQRAPRSPNDPLPTLWSSGHGNTVTDTCLRMKIARADENAVKTEATKPEKKATTTTTKISPPDRTIK